MSDCMLPALAWSSTTAATTVPELAPYGLSITGTHVDTDLGTEAGTDMGPEAGTDMELDVGIAPERIAAAS